MALPKIRELIEAIQDGVMDPNQATLLCTDPALYASQLGKWEFATHDKRIDKFKAMTPEGFYLAHGMYAVAKATNPAAAKGACRGLRENHLCRR